MTQTTDLTAEIDAIAGTIRQAAAACRHRPRPDSDRQAARQLTALARQCTRIAATAVHAGDTTAAGQLRALAAECTELAAEARHRGHLQVVPA